MAEHENAMKKTDEKVNQKHRIRQQEAHPSSIDKSLAWNQGLLSSTETPFYPRLDEHATIQSSIPFSAQRNEFIMRLHQTYGNRYVQKLLNSKAVQAKLTVSNPNDVYEQEADRVAEEVAKTMNSQVARQPEEEEEELQMKVSSLQRQPQEEEEEVMAKPASDIQRQEEEEEEEIQPKLLLQRQEEEEELQMQLSGSGPADVSNDVEARINSARSGGQPLSETARESMEPAFGTDFSGVRVHTDSEANTLNQQLSARAFTTGQDVFFREGEYSPGSDSGRKLLAHELAHVVQQNGSTLKRVKMNRDTEESFPRGSKISRQASNIVQRYEERIFNKGDYRLSDDKSMIVKQDSTAGSQMLLAKPGMAAASTAKLAAAGSVLELNEGRKRTLNIAASEPELLDMKNGVKTDYSEIVPSNKTTKTSGTAYSKSAGVSAGVMEIWDDCGRAARAIIGAEATGKAKAVYAGPEGEKETASTALPHQMKRELMLTYLIYWEKKHGVKIIDDAKLSGLQKSHGEALKQAQATSKDPKKSAKEKKREWAKVRQLDVKITECYWDAYNNAPAEWREGFDKWAKINRWAAPEVGQGYTISSGGARKENPDFDPTQKEGPDNRRYMSTWNFHWAGVIMKGGEDTVTLEGYAGSESTEWVYQMYGSAAAAEADASKKKQTFQEQHRDVALQHGETPTTMVVKK